jgi:hypothetical protein
VNVWPFLMNGGTATAAALQPVSTDRRIFLAGGQPWRWKGVSAFPLCDRFAHGEDIDPFLDAFAGFNLLRVWDYVMWPDTGWESNPAATWLAFLDYVGTRGWHVELTLLTDDDFTRVAPARQLVAALATAKPTNLVIEIGNEPREHKHIDVAALRSACEQSGFLFASGNNAVDEPWFGSFLTAHTPRDAEWPRKAHDLKEYFDGGGPGAPTDPARGVPCVGDEPMRPDEAGFVATDYRAYFGVCALLGAGGTFHFTGGKFGQLPTADEARCAAAALEGLDAFPASEPNAGGYRRIDEQGGSLRTYVVGNSMVRVRPTTKTAPEPGWTAIDADGILWRRQ